MLESTIRVDTRGLKDYMTVVKSGTRRVTNKVLRDIARDAALLAMAHEPHNMRGYGYIRPVVSELIPAVKALGAPAGYNDAGRFVTAGFSGRFRHPVFPDPNINRKYWHWVDQKNTKPFIEIAAQEVGADAELVMSVALQEMFDKA
jgi:hypothetical protein